MLRYIILFFVFTFSFTNGINWHSSQIILRHLYNLQDEQFAVVKKYLELETERLHELERIIIPIFDWYINYAYMKRTLILSHVDSLKLMSRVYNNLPKIKELLNNTISVKVIKQFDDQQAISEFNVQSAYRSLRRIQKFYSIPASDMAAGRYKDRNIGDPMDACECYIMSKCSFEEYDTYGVIDWAVQAYNKWLTDRPKCVDIDRLNYYTSSASMATGFSLETLSDFSNLNLLENTKHSAHFSLMANALNIRNIAQSADIYDKYDDFEQFDSLRIFRNLCRTGKSARPLTCDSKCRYQTKNSPYRMLMPFKEEDINSEPFIKIYHDVLYDNEILKIKTTSLANMRDAHVRTTGTNSAVDERSRSGQVNWINEFDANEYLDALNTRVESFTGFSAKTAELYQIVNYGLGGHYLPHHDTFLKGTEDMKFGNRLVTVLFYLTDVQNDGYTAFPMLDIIAPAEKGAALVWHNLNMSDGKLCYETLHGSCPVLKGNKLIMTRWLYEEGQHLPYNWKNK